MITAHRTQHIGGSAATPETPGRDSTVAGYAADMQQFELSSTSFRFASTPARADRSKGGEPT
jgi:hypothetical protein